MAGFVQTMDSLIAAAARALAAGDPLGALNRVALRDDAHALLFAAQDLAPERMGIGAGLGIGHRPARLASGCPRVEDMLGNR